MDTPEITPQEIQKIPENKPTEPIKEPEKIIEVEGSLDIGKKEYAYEEIKRLIGIQGTQEALAAILNVKASWVTHLKQTDPKFALALEIGKEHANALVKDALFENCTKYKDTAAQRFWLTNRCRYEFAERSKQEIEAKITTLDEVVKDLNNDYGPSVNPLESPGIIATAP